MPTVVTRGLLLVAATYGLARFGYGLFLPRLSETFAIGPGVGGVISAGSFLSYCAAALVASRLGRHPRRLVLAAGAAATLGSVGVAASPGVVVLAVSVLVAGAGAGFASPGLVGLVQRNVAPARQETAQSVVNAGTGVGIVAAGLLVLVSADHWRPAWLAVAVLAAAATVATLRADRRTGRSPAPASCADGDPTGETGEPPARARLADLRPLTRPAVAAALAGAGSAATWTFGPSVITGATDGDGATVSTVAWMVLGAFGVLGASAGALVQRWSLSLAWVATSGATALATLLLGLAPGSPALALAAVAVFGAAYTALSGVLIVWAVRVTPSYAAEGTVVLFVALAVGQALGSAGFGLVQGLAPVTVTFVLAGLVGLAALLPAVGRRHPAPGDLAATGSGSGLSRC